MRIASKIKEKLDLDVLRAICKAPIETIMEDLGGQIVTDGRGDKYAYKDNGSRILAVAHLDTVQDAPTWGVVRLEDETLVFSPQLDDRLGVYTILHILPIFGINVDILFTENEETGQSTAQDFELPEGKKYNWIVEFDRCGTDAVTYDFDWENIVQKFFKVGRGSYSDIAYLEDLGCMALNVGIGYENEHSTRAYFVIESYIEQIEKFVHFHKKYKVQRFKFKKKKSLVSRYVYGGDSWWDRHRGAVQGYLDETDDDAMEKVNSCAICNKVVTMDTLLVVDGELICDACAGLDQCLT